MRTQIYGAIKKQTKTNKWRQGSRIEIFHHLVMMMVMMMKSKVT